VSILDGGHTEGARRNKDESAGVCPRRSGRSVLWLTGAAVPRTVAHRRHEAQRALQVPWGSPAGTPGTLNVAPLPAMCRLALGAREENANA
jgi:hypothetical protein